MAALLPPRSLLRASSSLATIFTAGLLLGSLLPVKSKDGPASSAAPAPAALPSIPDVVEAVSPGVVSVGAVRSGYYLARDPFADFFTPFLARRVRYEERTPYMGSGFLVDGEGHVLTNYHVIAEADSVFVTFMDGREAPAQVLDADRIVDMALLKVDLPKEDLPEPLQMGDSTELRIGEVALAVGNPFGNLIADPRPTVTMGVVSALHRDFAPDSRNLRVYQDMIQTDAAINPGNSGGPLIDGRGRVIGINTFILSRDGASAGLGFAIPINRAKAFVQEILEHGRVRPLAIDFGLLSIQTPRVRGAVVNFVEAEGPAHDAGLEVGDILLQVDGRPVSGREDVLLLMATRTVGDTVAMRVLREGEELDLAYRINEAVARRAARR